MAVYFRSPGSSTTPFKVVVRPPNVYEEDEEVCLFFHQGFHNVRRMQVWCGVQMDPNVSNVLVLVYLLLFPGNTHFYSVNCGYSVSDMKKSIGGRRHGERVEASRGLGMGRGYPPPQPTRGSGGAS